MLFIGKCRQCAFLIGNIDLLRFKELLIDHLADSHKVKPVFASETRVSDFKDTFTIHRFKDTDVQASILLAMTTKSFWKAQRIPIVYA